LHAARIRLRHPENQRELEFAAELVPDNAAALREAIVEPDRTTAWRIQHGAGDRAPGVYVDRFGPYLLAQSQGGLPEGLDRLRSPDVAGIYHKPLLRKVGGVEASPQLVWGKAAPETFVILENGLSFEVSFTEGYSVGLFLDQRENRRRLLTGYIAPDFQMAPSSGRPPQLLNTFAYTCGFSVAAASAGWLTTSLDLSRKYLDWGRRNMALNGIDPSRHDFIYGDVFDWIRRLSKKGRQFNAIVLDPPTFSRSKVSGVFRAEKDYGRLVGSALEILEPEGILLASTNAAEWAPALFMDTLEKAVRKSGRRLLKTHYVPQPPDFPVSRLEPAYLKTAWCRIG
jgi:23S rRNA (cytosine1962-C5)-methyltransferase